MSLDPAHLSPLERLALGYAPGRVRALWLGWFALEARLADTARASREPVMIQLRLAWWRDRFAQPAAQWPAGEPLLAALQPWDAERAALGAVVDGYEAANVGEDGGAELHRARLGAMAALARLAGVADTRQPAVAQAAQIWLDGGTRGLVPALPRAMRPLTILAGLSASTGGTPWRDLGTLLRIATAGR